ncbi:hypothetical protein WV31_13200 [Magnetospirillum sp. ME-1]|nr:hypothetical protein WV31_13200 [Magnetospirillum sp. ME-1]
MLPVFYPLRQGVDFRRAIIGSVLNVYQSLATINSRGKFEQVLLIVMNARSHDGQPSRARANPGRRGMKPGEVWTNGSQWCRGQDMVE